MSVNLGIEKSIMVQKFFKRRNLKILKSSLSTGSEFPHFALTVVVELLKENEIIFWGTSGIGYDSITSMYLELYKICKDQEKIVFICHSRKKKLGQLDVIEINDTITVDKISAIIQKV